MILETSIFCFALLSISLSSIMYMYEFQHVDTAFLDEIELEDLYEITLLLFILSILIAVLNLIRHILFKRFKILIENIYNEKKLNIYEGAWTQRKIIITGIETIGILLSPSFLLIGKHWTFKTGEEH